mmetsp:Transcript_4007/g.7555  ORF Transcript_4007/g.7555 Transcript_4007/m.7555 type:complete len:255 (-) Transcript_4007:317-1081(-)
MPLHSFLQPSSSSRRSRRNRRARTFSHSAAAMTDSSRFHRRRRWFCRERGWERRSVRTTADAGGDSTSPAMAVGSETSFPSMTAFRLPPGEDGEDDDENDVPPDEEKEGEYWWTSTAPRMAVWTPRTIGWNFDGSVSADCECDCECDCVAPLLPLPLPRLLLPWPSTSMSMSMSPPDAEVAPEAVPLAVVNDEVAGDPSRFPGFRHCRCRLVVVVVFFYFDVIVFAFDWICWLFGRLERRRWRCGEGGDFADFG